jgi:hypothetical protein
LRLAISVALALALSVAAAEEIYRSIGPDGSVVYTDRPLDGSAERVTIATATPRAAPPAAVAAPTADPQDESAEEPGEAVVAQASAAQRTEERARNCEIARDRQVRYSQAHRIYRETADGEREYLDSDEIDAKRAEAEADVAEWCD